MSTTSSSTQDAGILAAPAHAPNVLGAALFGHEKIVKKQCELADMSK